MTIEKRLRLLTDKIWSYYYYENGKHCLACHFWGEELFTFDITPLSDDLAMFFCPLPDSPVLPPILIMDWRQDLDCQAKAIMTYLEAYRNLVREVFRDKTPAIFRSMFKEARIAKFCRDNNFSQY